MSDKRITAGIDIGCSSVKCLIALEDENGSLEIAGVGICPCSGHIREGVLVNASRASEAVRRAIEEAEETSGIEIESAFASITGLHVRGILGSSTMVLGEGRSESYNRRRCKECSGSSWKYYPALGMPCSRKNSQGLLLRGLQQSHGATCGA